MPLQLGIEGYNFLNQISQSAFTGGFTKSKDSERSSKLHLASVELFTRCSHCNTARTSLFPGGSTGGKVDFFKVDPSSVEYCIDKKNTYTAQYTGGVTLTSSNGINLLPKSDRGFNFRSLLIREGDLPPIEKNSEFILYGPPFYDFEAVKAYPKLQLFLLRLYLWESLPEVKSITASEIWSQSLRKRDKYISEYNDLFDYSLRFSLESDLNKLREYEGLDVVYMPSYSSLYPPRGLLFFDIEKDDIGYMYLQDTLCEEEYLEEFKYVLEDLLDHIPWDHIILPDSTPLGEGGSVSVMIEDNLVRERSNLSSFSNNSDFLYTENVYRAVRCHVPVDPSSYRDTVILDYRSSNTVRLIEAIVLEILHFVPESAFGGSGSDLHEKFLKLKGKEFACRDIKKCGLTINKRLLSTTLLILSKRIKSLEPFIDFFSTIKIIDGDRVYKDTIRGSGLGQANMLTTLIEIVIFRMAKRRYHKGDEVRGIIGNDDAIADQGWEFLEIWEDMETCLGQIYNSKKSFVSRSKLFFEEYSLDGWRDKKSLAVLSVALAYYLPIRECKQLICYSSPRLEPISDMVRDLVNYKGYEFFPEEYTLHYSAGGWFDLRANGLSTELVDYMYVWNKYGDEVLKSILDSVNSTSLPFYHSKSPTLFYEIDWKKYRYYGKISYRIKRNLPVKRNDHFPYKGISHLIKSKLPGKYIIPEELVEISYSPNIAICANMYNRQGEALRKLRELTVSSLKGRDIPPLREEVVYHLGHNLIEFKEEINLEAIRNDILFPLIKGSELFGYWGSLPSIEFWIRNGYTGSIDPFYSLKLGEEWEQVSLAFISPPKDSVYNLPMEEFLIEAEEDTIDDSDLSKYLVCQYHKELRSDRFYSMQCPICLNSTEYQDLVDQRMLPSVEIPSIDVNSIYLSYGVGEEDQEDEPDFEFFGNEEDEDW